MLRLPVGADARHGANLVVVRRTDLSATVRYHERLQPQPTFSSIIGLVLDADRGFLSQHFGPSSRVTTREGEYGVWIAVHGRYRGGPASRWIGAVMVGEFATALEVLGLAPEHFATVEALGRDLMHTQTFDMGQRPRQFFYKPPLGWHGLLSGMTANWYSLEFPRDRSIIVVPPARHIEGDPGEELEATVASLEAGLSVDDVVRERVRARCGAVRCGAVRCGVDGTRVAVRGRLAGRTLHIHRELVGFVVRSRLYTVRLETTMLGELARLQALLHDVAASFEPLDAPDASNFSRGVPPLVDLFEHWTD